jgi:hypothetical protein
VRQQVAGIRQDASGSASTIDCFIVASAEVVCSRNRNANVTSGQVCSARLRRRVALVQTVRLLCLPLVRN